MHSIVVPDTGKDFDLDSRMLLSSNYWFYLHKILISLPHQLLDSYAESAAHQYYHHIVIGYLPWKAIYACLSVSSVSFMEKIFAVTEIKILIFTPKAP